MRDKKQAVQAVIDWRKRSKARMVDIMGGKCVCCGYTNCLGALDFHHIDDAQKSFSLGSIRARPKSWDIVVAELKKCVLVCCRCHREITAGILNVDGIQSSFDDKYVDYKSAFGVVGENERKFRTQKKCQVCHNEFLVSNGNQKYCSLKCSKQSKISHIMGISNGITGKAHIPIKQKIRWPGSDQLLEAAKEIGYEAVGRKLGVTGASVKKRLKKYGVMLPKYYTQHNLY